MEKKNFNADHKITRNLYLSNQYKGDIKSNNNTFIFKIKLNLPYDLIILPLIFTQVKQKRVHPEICI